MADAPILGSSKKLTLGDVERDIGRPQGVALRLVGLERAFLGLDLGVGPGCEEGRQRKGLEVGARQRAFAIGS